MDKPKISWYAKLAKEEKFSGGNELFVGSNTPDDTLEVDIQLWNNRWGEVEVAELNDFQIAASFADYEDSSLLSCLSVKYNNQPINITVDPVARRALFIFPIPLSLSGSINNGSSIDKSCLKNFLSFRIEFKHPENGHLKESDLKSLRLEITRG